MFWSPGRRESRQPFMQVGPVRLCRMAFTRRHGDPQRTAPAISSGQPLSYRSRHCFLQAYNSQPAVKVSRSTVFNRQLSLMPCSLQLHTSVDRAAKYHKMLKKSANRAEKACASAPRSHVCRIYYRPWHTSLRWMNLSGLLELAMDEAGDTQEQNCNGYYNQSYYNQMDHSEHAYNLWWSAKVLAVPGLTDTCGRKQRT